MKILMLSPYPVYPSVFGGQIRIFELAKNLSRLGNDVTILANSTKKDNKENFQIDGVKIRYFKTYIQD